MASCECCWSASRFRAQDPDDGETAYGKTMVEHAERQCECVKPTRVRGRSADA